ncbi:MAG: serine/threonine-protein phosphatase, partial [Bacteroidales bacterium]|nr:serine/threonine-protein phosphatase [Bacteroidales bacterium]
MTQVKFRVAAYTDAAGRYNPDAPRNGNEDNMFVNADLGAPEGAAFFESDKEIVLSEYGCLLVVADGMGGMNAGEVASEIAVNVVKEAFAKETVPHSAMESSGGREKYLRKVVALADEAVKRHANAHPECEGMGSTLVLAWLKDGEASIAWLGDSRIYLFREPEGLRQVSKDHSYVQELVDAGKITEEEAFIHPYNNVITRSLGDMSKKADADSLTVKVFKGDILLLNSDGLSGVLHDQEMTQIIRENCETMSACRSALWKAAEEAGWHDNVTAVLCEITDGDEYVVEPLRDTADPEAKIDSDLDKTKINLEAVPPIAQKVGSTRPWIKRLSLVLTALAVLAVIGLLLIYFLGRRDEIREEQPVPEEVVDTVAVQNDSEQCATEPVPVALKSKEPAKPVGRVEKK